jgi:hypothetical protein
MNASDMVEEREAHTPSLIHILAAGNVKAEPAAR